MAYSIASLCAVDRRACTASCRRSEASRREHESLCQSAAEQSFWDSIGRTLVPDAKLEKQPSARTVCVTC